LIGAAVDWPGHFPNVRSTIETLVAAGADVNARCSVPHTEAPLHGPASSDDVEALDALLDAGADIEVPGAVIAGPAVRPWTTRSRSVSGTRPDDWSNAVRERQSGTLRRSVLWIGSNPILPRGVPRRPIRGAVQPATRMTM